MRQGAEVRRVSISIPKEVLEKFRYIAAYDCRSVSSMIRLTIKERIAEFERENGKIGP